MSQKDQQRPSDEDHLPNECPSCKEVVEKLVLHISRNKSCHSNIDPELYDKWKLISRRIARRKYQAKYVQNGEHKEAQKKYESKFRQYNGCACGCGKKKHVNIEKRANYLEIKRHIQSKYDNRKKILKYEQDGEERLALFYRLCGLCFTALHNNCEVPIGIELRRFQLVEGDFHEGDHEEVHAWLKDVDTKLLEMVITFQKIVLVPRSRWIRAVEKVESNSENNLLKVKLYTLIGKLNALKHFRLCYNVCICVIIPEEYKFEQGFYRKGARSVPRISSECYRDYKISYWGGKALKIKKHQRLPEEMKLYLCNVIDAIIGEDIEDLYDLLCMTQDMKNLRIACLYTQSLK